VQQGFSATTRETNHPADPAEEPFPANNFSSSSSSSITLSELPLLSSVFGFPDLPTAQQQGNVGYYVGKFCAFVKALEQQVGLSLVMVCLR
jgi:hypothetical protein